MSCRTINGKPTLTGEYDHDISQCRCRIAELEATLTKQAFLMQSYIDESAALKRPSELCHLKGCGKEAVIGRMERWGPEYRVAMCEDCIMERLAEIATLKAERDEFKDEMFRYRDCVTL
mgnify:FL=1